MSNSIRMAVPRLGSLLLSKRLLVPGKGCVTSSLGQNLGNNQAGFSTTSRLRDIFFTKKHEWVRVDGSQGNLLQIISKFSIIFFQGQ